MKKTSSKKKILYIIAPFVIAFLFIVWALLAIGNNVTPADPNILTLSQGRSMKYEDISIGLGNVSGDSGWISVHKDGGKEDSIHKTIKTGDKVDVYGYTMEIKSMNAVTNLSVMPGSSNGYITFVINKK